MGTVRKLNRARSRALPAVAVSCSTALSLALGAWGAGAASASTSNPAPPTTSVSIGEAGSTLLEPLFQMWASAYHHKYSNIAVNVSGGGSGKGISDAAGGVVSIGASDAYLSGSDRSSYPGLNDVAVAISAQMVNYNVQGLSPRTHLDLSGRVLSEMYSGKVTWWDDGQIRALNRGVKLPHEKIVALHPADASGDTFLSSSYLSATDPNGWGKSVGYSTSIGFPSVNNSLGETGNGGMVTGCQATPGCVAYIGISYKSGTDKAGLGKVALQNKSGKFELPTAQAIAAEAAAFVNHTPANEAISMIYGPAATGYPIINYEYAIVPATEPNNAMARAVKALLYWAVGPNDGGAQSFLGQVNFEPLPPGVIKLSDNLISKIGD